MMQVILGPERGYQSENGFPHIVIVIPPFTAEVTQWPLRASARMQLSVANPSTSYHESLPCGSAPRNCGAMQSSAWRQFLDTLVALRELHIMHVASSHSFA